MNKDQKNTSPKYAQQKLKSESSQPHPISYRTSFRTFVGYMMPGTARGRTRNRTNSVLQRMNHAW